MLMSEFTIFEPINFRMPEKCTHRLINDHEYLSILILEKGGTQ